MIRTPDASSISFRALVEQGRAPVIMQVVPALKAGGVEQGVIDTSAAIVKAGGKSIVVSSGGARAHEIAKAGGTHVTLPVNSKNPLVMAANIGRLRRIIRDMGVDLVHACSRAPAWSCASAVRGTTARYVTSCHAAHPIGSNLKRLYNSALTKGERVIAVSHFLADYLEQNYRVDPQLLRVVHRGVALEKFHPNSVTPERLVKVSKAWRVPEGASVIMLLGRFTRVKGHMFLLDAIAQLGRRDIFCLFVATDPGDGDYRAELEAYIDSKGLGPQVRMVTNCDDIPAAYMISTVVVSASVVPEGFGRVPVEAQAMGRPVIATDHGATRETIIRDETGWLVPPGNVTEMAKALAEAMALDARGRAILGTRAMSHVAKYFTNEQMCAATLDVYAELINSGVKALPSNDADKARAAG